MTEHIPNPVPPPSMPDATEPNDELVAELCAAWLKAKGAESAANAERLGIELRMDDLLGATIGAEESTTLNRAGYKIVIGHSLNRKVDIAKAKPFIAIMPEEIAANLIKVKEEADSTGLKWLAVNRPDLYQLMSSAVTTKPAKTSIKVEVAK